MQDRPLAHVPLRVSRSLTTPAGAQQGQVRGGQLSGIGLQLRPGDKTSSRFGYLQYQWREKDVTLDEQFGRRSAGVVEVFGGIEVRA